MKLTTKGRYAVMAMASMAQNDIRFPVSLATIAANQDIDIGYLEKIFNILKKKGLVHSIKGPGGGYILANHSKDISIISIINAVEENINMNRCNEINKTCSKPGIKCLTHNLWKGLTNQIDSYLSSISLADICENNI